MKIHEDNLYRPKIKEKILYLNYQPSFKPITLTKNLQNSINVLNMSRFSGRTNIFLHFCESVSFIDKSEQRSGISFYTRFVEFFDVNMIPPISEM